MPTPLRIRAASTPRPATTADEARLVARGQRDPAAFAPLYAGYLGPVYRYCVVRLGTKEAAEDATALVFAKALAALPRYRPHDRPDTFRAWLFAIAHNVVADEHRRRVHRPVEPLAAAEEIPATVRSPDELAVAADDVATLRRHLARLSPDQRRVVELRLGGLSDREIAEVLGRSHGAVRTSQFRAVARLRELFGVHAAREETSE